MARPGPDPALVERARGLAAQGSTQAQASQALGVPVRTLQAWGIDWQQGRPRVPEEQQSERTARRRAQEERTMILAYLDDSGAVATMPVSDRDQFQRGVTTPEAWEAMSGAERAELAASSVGPAQIRHRERARKGPSKAFRAAHKPLAEWSSGPRIMFEGTGLGVIAWERGRPGEWKPASGPVEVATPDGPRNIYGSEGSMLLPKEPVHALHRDWAGAKAGSDAIIAAAPVITAALLEELDQRTENGEDAAIVYADGELRISAPSAGRVVCTGMARASRLARHADTDGEPYGHQPTYESEAAGWQQQFLGSL